jgi:NAD(P)-dependent dehydrogenase (short-subunit alcohol dehydrogenase family)
MGEKGHAMSGLCAGRVVVITGAGRGIGREHALAFAAEGAQVVVNDLGGSTDGSGSDDSPAQQVVAEIEAMGQKAIASTDDISDWDGAARLIQLALDTFGGLDVVVNNAGILRDRMFVNMTPQEWDSVSPATCVAHWLSSATRLTTGEPAPRLVSPMTHASSTHRHRLAFSATSVRQTTAPRRPESLRLP